VRLIEHTIVVVFKRDCTWGFRIETNILKVHVRRNTKIFMIILNHINYVHSYKYFFSIITIISNRIFCSNLKKKKKKKKINKKKVLKNKI